MIHRLITLVLSLTFAVAAFATNPRLETMQFFSEQYRRMPNTKVVITSSGSTHRYYSISVSNNEKLEHAIEKAVQNDRARAFNVVETYTTDRTSIVLNIQVNNCTVSLGYSRDHDSDEEDETYVKLFVSGPPEAFK
ncbi:MAG: hypothetical protein Q4C34_04260 [Bacteroidales bacterium]|nr:hypothetical protein [Bacteroidales bacterium]